MGDYLYHYTTTEGFKGIIKRQELWATSIYHLNDWTEFECGKKAFVESAKAQMKDSDDADAAALLLDCLCEARPPLYVCSFSSADDDLPQWRAYSHPYGCAIGFEAHTLFTYAGTLGFDLTVCKYEMAGIANVTKATVEIAGEIMGLAGGVERFRSLFASGDLSRNALLAQIMKLLATYKDDAFHYEHEQRLVCFPQPHEHPKFRLSGGVRVPYLPFNLKNDALWKQAKVVVSPRSPERGEVERQSVAAFLESTLAAQNLPTDCAKNVQLSQRPYRPTLGG